MHVGSQGTVKRDHREEPDCEKVVETCRQNPWETKRWV